MLLLIFRGLDRKEHQSRDRAADDQRAQHDLPPLEVHGADKRQQHTGNDCGEITDALLALCDEVKEKFGRNGGHDADGDDGKRLHAEDADAAAQS